MAFARELAHGKPTRGQRSKTRTEACVNTAEDPYITGTRRASSSTSRIARSRESAWSPTAVTVMRYVRAWRPRCGDVSRASVYSSSRLNSALAPAATSASFTRAIHAPSSNAGPPRAARRAKAARLRARRSRTRDRTATAPSGSPRARERARAKTCVSAPAVRNARSCEEADRAVAEAAERSQLGRRRRARARARDRRPRPARRSATSPPSAARSPAARCGAALAGHQRDPHLAISVTHGRRGRAKKERSSWRCFWTLRRSGWCGKFHTIRSHSPSATCRARSRRPRA